jgi:hypothetical protein
VVARVDARSVPQRGSTIRLAAEPNSVHLFNAESGDRMPL